MPHPFFAPFKICKFSRMAKFLIFVFIFLQILHFHCQFIFAQFVTGADVSWVSMQEKNGITFANSASQKTDLFVLLKNLKLNAVRLRVWVNPSGGWNDGADTLYKAKRAVAQGLKIMIDFHYSDSWADPGQQNPPAAWKNHNLTQLNTDVYQHTKGILKYLKQNGINVDWVQVGNEINGGMLWPIGDVRNNKNFGSLSQMLTSGYNAVKAVFPNAKVIVHLAKGFDNNLFQWFFDGIKNNGGGKYDIIGMSHYPTLDGANANDWQTKNNQIGTTMTNLVKRYGKPVMVVEVGMPWDQAANCQKMIADLVKRVKALGKNGLGVFYWEPQAYPGYQGYNWGAMDNSGKFTVAMNALKN